MDVNDDAGRVDVRGAGVCVRIWRRERLKIDMTRGNTSISRISIMRYPAFFNEWYNVYIRGTYHTVKTQEISWPVSA